MKEREREREREKEREREREKERKRESERTPVQAERGETEPFHADDLSIGRSTRHKRPLSQLSLVR
jgi:hypothetical protein